MLDHVQTQQLIYGLDELETATPDWAAGTMTRFVADLLSAPVPFPCPFGVQNYKQKTLRFAFVDSDAEGLAQLGDAIVEFLKVAPSLGISSSLVAVFRTAHGATTVPEYDAWFWSVLQSLHDNDPQPWPDDIPTDLEDKKWAYAFGGESYFIVCNTPAHVNRPSRFSELPLITFTPRWSFKGIEGDTPAGVAVRESIREKVKAFDKIPPSPVLSAYGEGLDWVQYFLPDNNEEEPGAPRMTVRRKVVSEV
jgi:FPC/CPF motif-containing protein YcgG